MSFARTLASSPSLSRTWLAAITGTMFAALILTASGVPSTVATVDGPAPSSDAVTVTDEPWTPSTMFYDSSEYTAPTEHRLPLSLDDLNPECTCIGFF